MASTGCPSGEVQTRLRLGQFDEALKSAADYQDIFGKENYFLELMDHGLDIERRVRDGLVEIGRKLNIPPVVTNDSHYTTGKRLGQPRRCCCASRPARRWPTRTASGSTAAATTSSPRPRCTPSTARTSGRRAAATASC